MSLKQPEIWKTVGKLILVTVDILKIRLRCSRIETWVCMKIEETGYSLQRMKKNKNIACQT